MRDWPNTNELCKNYELNIYSFPGMARKRDKKPWPSLLTVAAMFVIALCCSTSADSPTTATPTTTGASEFNCL